MQLVGTLDGGKKRTGHCCGNFSIPYFTNGFVLSLFLQKRQDITSFPAINVEELLRYSLLLKDGAAKITTMLYAASGRTDAQDGGIPVSQRDRGQDWRGAQFRSA